MSEVNNASPNRFGQSSREVSIWQRDELLLVLKSTDRCLPLEDIAKFVYFLEDVLPSDKVVKFLGIPSISRQLGQMIKSGLVEKKSSCYRITEKGLKFAEEAELSIEQDEEIDQVWHATRDILSNLPVSRLKWDSYLDTAFRQLESETQAPNEVQ
nr:hypothetical protein [Candidatus Njordarchaeota archaeon]